MIEAIKVVEVGPRDGLQNEKRLFSLEEKVRLIKKLESAGLSFIEIGAFVSPKWIPQMADTDLVCEEILNNKEKNTKKDVSYSCLVPNEEGLKKALKSGLKEIAVFGACSESFSQKISTAV